MNSIIHCKRDFIAADKMIPLKFVDHLPLNNLKTQPTLRTANQPAVSAINLKKRSNKTIRNPHNQQLKINLCTQRTALFDKLNSQRKFKEQIKSINQITESLGEVLKLLEQQLKRHQLLNQLISLTKIQISLSHQPTKPFTNNRVYQSQQSMIQKEKTKIQKILNQKNQILNCNNKFAENIQEQRKIRLAYEIYFYQIERELQKNRIIYIQYLARNLENMPLSNENPRVKENETEREINLLKNSNACFQARQGYSEAVSNQFTNSQKIIRKKLKSEKNVKISRAKNHFTSSSQQSQTSIDKQTVQIENKSQAALSLLNNKKKQNPKKFYQRPAAISAQFINNTSECYEQKIVEIVYELSRFYQQLGINIFTNNSLKSQHVVEDYFSFDLDQVVSKSKIRIAEIARYQQQGKEFNQILSNKITSTDQKTSSVQNNIFLLKKKIIKLKESHFCQETLSAFNSTRNEKSSSQCLQVSNQSIYQKVASLLSINFDKTNGLNQFNEPNNLEDQMNKLLSFELQLKTEKIVENKAQQKKFNGFLKTNQLQIYRKQMRYQIEKENQTKFVNYQNSQQNFVTNHYKKNIDFINAKTGNKICRPKTKSTSLMRSEMPSANLFKGHFRQKQLSLSTNSINNQ